MIDHATEIVKELILKDENINIAVDMTAGNGNDSKFILENTKAKKVFAFDIQELAKKNTLALIGDEPKFNLF